MAPWITKRRRAVANRLPKFERKGDKCPRMRR